MKVAFLVYTEVTTIYLIMHVYLCLKQMDSMLRKHKYETSRTFDYSQDGTSNVFWYSSGHSTAVNILTDWETIVFSGSSQLHAVSKQMNINTNKEWKAAKNTANLASKWVQQHSEGWGVSVCSFLTVSRSSSGTFCLHLQGRRVSCAINRQEANSVIILSIIGSIHARAMLVLVKSKSYKPIRNYELDDNIRITV
jgi:hypothetical protein